VACCIHLKEGLETEKATRIPRASVWNAPDVSVNKVENWAKESSQKRRDNASAIWNEIQNAYLGTADPKPESVHSFV